MNGHQTKRDRRRSPYLGEERELLGGGDVGGRLQPSYWRAGGFLVALGLWLALVLWLLWL